MQTGDDKLRYDGHSEVLAQIEISRFAECGATRKIQPDSEAEI
jgi:hypothetical protein